MTPVALPPVPRRILVPTDLSAGAAVALGHAQVLAIAFGATIDLLHVVDLEVETIGSAARKAQRAGSGALAADLEAVADGIRRNGVDAEIHIRNGHAGDTIVAAARVIGSDMIVMGTHGRTGFRRLAVGSVVDHVIRHSIIPVLAVRRPE